jgi:hypothetical protein
LTEMTRHEAPTKDAYLRIFLVPGTLSPPRDSLKDKIRKIIARWTGRSRKRGRRLSEPLRARRRRGSNHRPPDAPVGGEKNSDGDSQHP